MLYHMNNIFQNTAFWITVDVPLMISFFSKSKLITPALKLSILWSVHPHDNISVNWVNWWIWLLLMNEYWSFYVLIGFHLMFLEIKSFSFVLIRPSTTSSNATYVVITSFWLISISFTVRIWQFLVCLINHNVNGSFIYFVFSDGVKPPVSDFFQFCVSNFVHITTSNF